MCVSGWMTLPRSIKFSSISHLKMIPSPPYLYIYRTDKR